MSRFRRFVRSIAKPAAMVGVVGMLSLSLVISTPANAQAFDMGDTITKEAPRIFGAVKTMAPKAAEVAFEVGTAVTPAGWALKAGRLLLLAFSTSDLWMPYVTGLFGESTGSNPSTDPVAGSKVWSGLTMSGVHTVNTTVLSIDGNYSGTGATTSSLIGYAIRLYCKNPTTNVVTERTGLSGSGFGTTVQGAKFIQVYCGSANFGGTSTETIIGGVVGAPGSDPVLPAAGTSGIGSYNGPANVFRWGTAVTATAGFDPRGSNVGYQGQAECITPDGVKSWISGPVIAGNAGGVQMPSCAAAGKGHGTGKNKVVAFKPDGTQETVWDASTAPTDPAAPLCDAGLPGSGCVLEITKDGQPCVAGDVECENWASQNAADPNKDTSTARFKCKFGPYIMPMASCKLLEQAYRPGGALTTDANTDGDPSTQDNTNFAGQPVPQPAGSPVTTGTGGQPVPGGAGQTTPSADTESKNCFPQGWAALNPVEWVVKPVGCALRSAFIPSNSVVQTQATRIQTKINTVGFASIATAWTSTFQSVGGSGGCSGPTVRFQFNSVDQSFQPFSACSQPMATVAGITNAVSSIIIVLCGGLGIMRAIGTGFGFNFSFGKGGSAE